MIHLDTHVIIWLHAGEAHRLSIAAREGLAREPGQVSPIVLLELQFLHERGRLALPPGAIFEKLAEAAAVAISDTQFAAVVAAAQDVSWTRDPFDRLIVATAIAAGVPLISADAKILANFAGAVW